MKINFLVFKPILFLGISILLIGLLVLISNSPLFDAGPDVLSLTITLDLLISIPLIYYLLIRKTNIPISSVSTIVVLGLVIGVFIIPYEHHQYLNLFRIWLLPLVELSVVLFIIYKVRAALKTKNEFGEATFDFFSALKHTCYKIIPKPLAAPLATEISVVFYGLFDWKKRVLKKNEFSYHRNNATISTLVAVIFILAIETLAFHVLLMGMSNRAAWILTFCSLYTIVQILGCLRSIIKRPIFIGKKSLILRYGILRETRIELNDIKSFELSNKEIDFNNRTKRLSPLGAMDGHNVIVELNRVGFYSGFYGIKRKFKTIAFFVDNAEDFKIQLDAALNDPIL